MQKPVKMSLNEKILQEMDRIFMISKNILTHVFYPVLGLFICI